MNLEYSKDKRVSLCPVKFCRNPRSKHRGNGVCSKCSMRVWRANHPIRAAWSTLKWNATKAGKAVLITFEEFERFCATTGYHELRGQHADDMHIDRINNRLMYQPGNIRMITCRENSVKGQREKMEAKRERALLIEDPF